jgi:hypothetical protein
MAIGQIEENIVERSRRLGQPKGGTVLSAIDSRVGARLATVEETEEANADDSEVADADNDGSALLAELAARSATAPPEPRSALSPSPPPTPRF